jgi:hypothetical protein
MILEINFTTDIRFQISSFSIYFAYRTALSLGLQEGWVMIFYWWYIMIINKLVTNTSFRLPVQATDI